MSELNFSEFFHSVHAMPPLPWQTRLATHLIEQRHWPSLIDLPTACGKTACIDIAVFHLALCADRGEPWLAARRIAVVVDRRIIVDAAFVRAERICEALAQPQSQATAAVAKALEKLGGKPLICQKLRGGMPQERGFALDPAQPMVITSTIDQIGSRLLFRGYGLSPYSQPLHAGLLGHDTLILLDEAHLGGPFIDTIAAVQREQKRARHQLVPVRPVHLVSLSATAPTTGDRFQLNEEDFAHPVIKRRRTAPKVARLVAASGSATEHLKVLLRETLATYRELKPTAPAVAVIVNRVKTARSLFTKLQAEAKRDFDVKLVTGRSRPLDRDVLAKWLIARTGAGREVSSEDRGLIVVATQALEVGADLDFQGMVTECAALDAVRQRFGRLDRLGNFRNARAVIVGSAHADVDPIYGSALATTWQWLCNIAREVDGYSVVDFSIDSIEVALRSADLESMVGVPREALQLTPAHVELLCQTSPRPTYDPDVSALLHGFQSAQPEIQVIWRADVPAKRDGGQWSLDGSDSKLVNDLLTINPPTSLEALSLPLFALRSWLLAASALEDLSDVEGIAAADEEDRFIRTRFAREVWKRTEDEWKLTSISKLRPGDTIVIPTLYGGCDEFGFAPEDSSEVVDLCRTAREELKREAVVMLTPNEIRKHVADESGQAVQAAWRAAVDAYESQTSAPEEIFQQLIGTLGIVVSNLGMPANPEVEMLITHKGSLYALILRNGRIGAEDISDEGISSSRTVPVRLDAHNAAVGKRVRALAVSVGLDETYGESLRRAGDTHDLGKADPRFQRLLRGGDNITLGGHLVAKGLRRVGRARAAPAERHEAYSVALLKAYPDLLNTAPIPDLALYAVGTHHGRGRAFMPDRNDEGVFLRVDVGARTLQMDGAPLLGELGSGWPSLFWRLNERYGAWGLAYLEALLRLADHLQSRAELDGETDYV
jgi:CRISPR-associated endonuclease/helicase Cas3